MEDVNNARKENSTELVDVTHGHGTPVPKESASQLEQKLLKFQKELDQLGERIEEGIKSGMVTNLKALQATNKALQSGGESKKRDVGALYEKLKAASYVTPIPAITPENPSQWVNLNKSCAYQSGMKGYTIDECRSLKDKIQALIDNKIIVAKEPALNVCNNPLPDHKGGGIHMIEIEDYWDLDGSIGLITEGDDPKKPIVTLNPIIVQIQPSGDAEVNMFVPLELEATAKTSTPIKVEFVTPANAPPPFEVAVLPPKAHASFEVKMSTPISVAMSAVTPFHTKAIPWDYTVEARRKDKVRFEETVAAQGMTRTGRVYTPEHLAESSKKASNQPPIIVMGPDDLWRKIQAKKYSVIDQLNKYRRRSPYLLCNFEAHKNALLRVISEAYMPSNITGEEMANMVGQILIDGGSSLNICPLVTLKKLGKGLHEIKDGAINVKAFDASQRSTIGEINLCLQMGPTWFDVDFQVIDVPASYNLQLGWPWIYASGAVASTLHQAVNNPIYSRQTIPSIKGRKKLGGETYHRIERVNAVDKEKWWDNKIESILNWCGYESGKGLDKNLQGIAKPIKLKKHGTTFGLGYEYTWEELNSWSPPWRGPYYPLEQPIPHLEQTFQPADIIYGSEEEEALAAVKNLFLEDSDMDYHVILEEEGEESPSIQAEAELDNAEWVKSRYEQLALFNGKRMNAVFHG
ncbi:uncharacterized protein [Nicotiana sylvestris]|uniref:uncharacterized protein n=1 Tax=Nicotiana sylvestris TaxID=4096 RepID=UPI00388CAC70